MSNWNYGDAYKRHPIEHGIAKFNDGSQLKAHNIFDPLPDFIRQADLIFTDPPWNIGNLESFYTKASRIDYPESFEQFYRRLFDCIAIIRPKICYIEVGKEYLADFIMQTKKIFRSVTFYNSMYYHKTVNHCYIIRGSHAHKKMPLDGMDEEDIIKWICANEDYDCIGDLCMGRGLVASAAFKNSKRFVGTELNPKRLSVAIERLVKSGAEYEVRE